MDVSSSSSSNQFDPSASLIRLAEQEVIGRFDPCATSTTDSRQSPLLPPLVCHGLVLVGVVHFFVMLISQLITIRFARTYLQGAPYCDDQGRTVKEESNSSTRSLPCRVINRGCHCLLDGISCAMNALLCICSSNCLRKSNNGGSHKLHATPANFHYHKQPLKIQTKTTTADVDVSHLRLSPSSSVSVIVSPPSPLSPPDSLQVKLPSINSRPGVSILKPLSGADVNLASNLESFFRLEYPLFELVFCLYDSADSALPIVSELREAHPWIDSRVVYSDHLVDFVNPKVANLQAGYEKAKYDIILISDSGLWMQRNTLGDMVDVLTSDPKVGMVHQLPFILPILSDSQRLSLSWLVQLIFFGCWHAKVYISANLFNINCTTGMSCMIRRSILTPINGFDSFGCFLAEDFFLSEHIHHQGWLVKLAHQPAWQNSPSPSIGQFVDRLCRWAQLRLHMVPLSYAAEPLSRCLPSTVISALTASYLFPNYISFLVWFLCHLLTWFLLDYIQLCQLLSNRRGEAPSSRIVRVTPCQFAAGWLICELMPYVILVKSLTRRTIEWRGRPYKLHWGGLTERLRTVAGKGGDKSLIANV